MGITGLLGTLKSITTTAHLSEYRGSTVGVDAHCWLHRGAYSCSTELCQGIETDKYVTFCMRRVALLRSHGTEPILVFDGAPLPIKGDKNKERGSLRRANREKGLAALADGEAAAAHSFFAKGVSVTSGMVQRLIQELRRANVKFLVAPYEADAQLAYLSHTGVVDCVITEDSDCIPYGCKKVLFKLESDGSGKEIQRRNLAANETLSFAGWTNSMFLDMCLLAGCDYLPSIRGMGIMTAHKMVARHKDHQQLLKALRKSNFDLGADYEERYRMARLTFRHQRVYDPKAKRLTHLMALRPGTAAEDLSFLGPELSQAVAQGVAEGLLDPHSKQPYLEDPPRPLHPHRTAERRTSSPENDENTPPDTDSGSQVLSHSLTSPAEGGPSPSKHINHGSSAASWLHRGPGHLPLQAVSMTSGAPLAIPPPRGNIMSADVDDVGTWDPLMYDHAQHDPTPQQDAGNQDVRAAGGLTTFTPPWARRQAGGHCRGITDAPGLLSNRPFWTGTAQRSGQDAPVRGWEHFGAGIHGSTGAIRPFSCSPGSNPPSNAQQIWHRPDCVSTPRPRLGTPASPGEACSPPAALPPWELQAAVHPKDSPLLANVFLQQQPPAQAALPHHTFSSRTTGQSTEPQHFSTPTEPRTPPAPSLTGVRWGSTLPIGATSPTRGARLEGPPSNQDQYWSPMLQPDQNPQPHPPEVPSSSPQAERHRPHQHTELTPGRVRALANAPVRLADPHHVPPVHKGWAATVSVHVGTTPGAGEEVGGAAGGGAEWDDPLETHQDDNAARDHSGGRLLGAGVAPYVPVAAHLFTSHCVSDSLETLQRRKRRLMDPEGPEYHESDGQTGVKPLKWLWEARRAREEADWESQGLGSGAGLDPSAGTPQPNSTPPPHEGPMWVFLNRPAVSGDDVGPARTSGSLQSSVQMLVPQPMVGDQGLGSAPHSPQYHRPGEPSNHVGGLLGTARASRPGEAVSSALPADVANRLPLLRFLGGNAASTVARGTQERPASMAPCNRGETFWDRHFQRQYHV